MRKRYYYHITAKENALSILKEGLKANSEGEIFLFDNISVRTITAKFNVNGKPISENTIINVADHIAKSQLFLKEYVMFEVDSRGFETELIQDVCGEICFMAQWILKQSNIKPSFIIPYGRYRI